MNREKVKISLYILAGLATLLGLKEVADVFQELALRIAGQG